MSTMGEMMLMLVMMYCMPDCGAMTGIDTHPSPGTGWPGGVEDSIGLVLGLTIMHKYLQMRGVRNVPRRKTVHIICSMQKYAELCLVLQL